MVYLSEVYDKKINTWSFPYPLTYHHLTASKADTITTNVVSLNPAHGKVYSIQDYVIKFVSDLQHCTTKKTSNQNGISNEYSFWLADFGVRDLQVL
jgi:hypothetical protein